MNAPNSLRCVLFDLDGTLLDTASDFSAVLDAMALHHNYPAPSFATVHASVSGGARALITSCFGIQQQQAGFDALLDELLARYYQQIQQSQAVLYPGLPELLEELQQFDIPWGVVTNKAERFSRPLLNRLGLSRQCAALICPDHVNQNKPDPEGVLLAARTLGCQAEEAVYIGDHPRDIQAGLSAGMYTIAAAYGYIPPEPPVASWGAHQVVNHASEIQAYLPLHYCTKQRDIKE